MKQKNVEFGFIEILLSYIGVSQAVYNAQVDICVSIGTLLVISVGDIVVVDERQSPKSSTVQKMSFLLVVSEVVGVSWFVLYVGAIDIQIIARLGLYGVMCLVSGILVFLYVGR